MEIIMKMIVDNEESDGNELENNYYRENEEQNVIHDW
jgi:hypothetical protein